MTDQLMREALTRYRLQISILKKGYAQERYRIEQLSRSFLGDMVVRDITSVHIATYRDMRLSSLNPKTKLLLSAASVRLEMSLLSNFFDIARIEWGFCTDNPVKLVRKPKTPPGRERRLTPREDRRILRYAFQHSNPHLYSIIVLALETAMRQGEILGLHWEHINLKSRVAHLPTTKNGEKRDVPLSLKAREALTRLGVKSSGRIFGYTKEGIKSSWRYMTVKLEIEDLHFHDLRHEAISRLVERGVFDLMEVAAISGHKSLAMLKRYTHLKAQRLVRKLDAGTNKGKATVLSHLVPYPAIVDQEAERFCIRILDFDGLTAHGPDMVTALQTAQDVLLRQILISMRTTSDAPPSPDRYLENIDESRIIMIDPLATNDLV